MNSCKTCKWFSGTDIFGLCGQQYEYVNANNICEYYEYDNSQLRIYELCQYARYSDRLELVIKKLNGIKVLRCDVEAGYSGHVDIDVLLADGRVFSYKYYYGSCGICDDWENRGLSNKEIMQEMLEGATIFRDLETYKKWRKKCKQL